MPDLQAQAACPATAELIVMRGRKRLYLCRQHRGRYTGRGRVEAYAQEHEAVDPWIKPVFRGPARRCGETTE